MSKVALLFSVSASVFMLLCLRLFALLRAGRQAENLAVGFVIVAMVIEEIQRREVQVGPSKLMACASALRWTSFVIGLVLVIGLPMVGFP